MRRLNTLLFAGLFALLMPAAAFGQEPSKATTSRTAKLQITQCALKVSGMVCSGCADLVEKGLANLDGVKTAKVDFKTGEVKVGYDPKKTTPEKIVTAFNRGNPGFRAEQLRQITK